MQPPCRAGTHGQGTSSPGALRASCTIFVASSVGAPGYARIRRDMPGYGRTRDVGGGSGAADAQGGRGSPPPVRRAARMACRLLFEKSKVESRTSSSIDSRSRAPREVLGRGGATGLSRRARKSRGGARRKRSMRRRHGSTLAGLLAALLLALVMLEAPPVDTHEGESASAASPGAEALQQATGLDAREIGLGGLIEGRGPPDFEADAGVPYRPSYN